MHFTKVIRNLKSGQNNYVSRFKVFFTQPFCSLTNSSLNLSTIMSGQTMTNYITVYNELDYNELDANYWKR